MTEEIFSPPWPWLKQSHDQLDKMASEFFSHNAIVDGVKDKPKGGIMDKQTIADELHGLTHNEKLFSSEVTGLLKDNKVRAVLAVFCFEDGSTLQVNPADEKGNVHSSLTSQKQTAIPQEPPANRVGGAVEGD